MKTCPTCHDGPYTYGAKCRNCGHRELVPSITTTAGTVLPVQVNDAGVRWVDWDDETLNLLPPGWAWDPICGRAWDDDHGTSLTPVPGGRCPFEYEHPDEEA